MVTIQTVSGVVTVEADSPPERRGNALDREVRALECVGWGRTLGLCVAYTALTPSEAERQIRPLTSLHLRKVRSPQ